MPPTPDALDLAAHVAALPLTVDGGSAVAGAVALPDYPDGPRPTTEVRLDGEGHTGRGEHVAFTEAEQQTFRDACTALATGTTTVGAWSLTLLRRHLPPYERAALEAAGIDLALRQAGTNLFALAGVAPRSIRYVVSCDGRNDPVETAARVAREAPGVALKLDVASGWDDDVWRRLAERAPIAILDWKGGGTAADFARAHAALPDALHEDPGDGFPTALASRLARDASVGSADDVPAFAPAPAAVNVKPARIGGVLESLAVAAECASRAIVVYVGGMWEVGVGRRQLQVLAALVAPDGPNDVAPLGPQRVLAPRLAIDPGALGFG